MSPLPAVTLTHPQIAIFGSLGLIDGIRTSVDDPTSRSVRHGGSLRSVPGTRTNEVATTVSRGCASMC